MEERRAASKRRLMASLRRPDTALLEHISPDDATVSYQFQSLARGNRIKKNIAHPFSRRLKAQWCMPVPRLVGPKVGPERWQKKETRRKLLKTSVLHLHGKRFSPLAVGTTAKDKRMCPCTGYHPLGTVTTRYVSHDQNSSAVVALFKQKVCKSIYI